MSDLTIVRMDIIGPNDVLRIRLGDLKKKSPHTVKAAAVFFDTLCSCLKFLLFEEEEHFFHLTSQHEPLSR